LKREEGGKEGRERRVRGILGHADVFGKDMVALKWM